MVTKKQAREEKGNGALEAQQLALLAIGTSDGWTVTVDESTNEAQNRFLQIEGPSLNLLCEIEDLDVLDNVHRFLRTPGKPSECIVVGEIDRIPLRFLWDVEPEKRLLITIGPAARPLARISIDEEAVGALAAATQQVIRDL